MPRTAIAPFRFVRVVACVSEKRWLPIHPACQSRVPLMTIAGIEPAIPRTDSGKRGNVRSRKPSGNKSVVARREQILEVSARLFAEFGCEATSIRQIGDEIKMLPGSIYHHFDNKDSMIHEILKEPINRGIQDNDFISRIPLDAEHRLTCNIILSFYRQFSDWDAFRILHRDGNNLKYQEGFSYLEEWRSESFNLLHSILSEGMKTELFRSDIDLEIMIGTIFRMLSSAIARFRTDEFSRIHDPSKYTFDVVVDFHLDCILRMIRSHARIGEPIPREICNVLVMPR